MTHDKGELERLISRALDGELSPEERIQFDRLLIRDPDARQQYDECERIDAVAADALASAFAVPASPARTASGAAPRAGRDRLARGIWIVMAAAAACLALVLFRYPIDRGQEYVVTGQGARAPTQASPAAALPDQRVCPAVSADYRQRPAITDRTIDREWIGIRGSDGHVYWLRFDRTRTFTQSGSGCAIKLANEPL
jgi:hypothetical protein